MEYQPKLSELTNGMTLEGFYLLREASLRTTTAGKPFLSGVVQDKTGSVEIKYWDYLGPVEPDDVGRVIKLRGEAAEYKGALQITVNRIRLANAADVYPISELVPTAPIDREGTLAEVDRIVGSIEDAEYRTLARRMLAERRERFASIPAAKSVHHSFLSGLLMHTANMLRIADFVAGIYPEFVNRSLLLCGTLLHDFAKTEEFAFSELGMVTDYTAEGKLLGHLVMGAEQVRAAAEAIGMSREKTMLLCHLILSHHGEPEFGAAVRPRCPEAELLYYIDGIDSRMEIYRETLADMVPGTFSPRVYALEKDIYKENN